MTRSNITALLTAIVVTCAFASAQVGQVAQTDSSVQAARAAPDTQFKQRDQRYRLRKNDVIDVKFTFSPEFNQTITVPPDGYITLDGAGAIQAENKTLAELTENIRRAYSGILHKPAITVSLKDFDNPFFLAAGQVGKPGKDESRSDTTLTEAVAIAGGLTEASKHSQVALFRRVSEIDFTIPAFDRISRQLRFCCKGQVTRLESCYEVAGFAVAGRIESVESGQLGDDIEEVAADLLARQ